MMTPSSASVSRNFSTILSSVRDDGTLGTASRVGTATSSAVFASSRDVQQSGWTGARPPTTASPAQGTALAAAVAVTRRASAARARPQVTLSSAQSTRDIGIGPSPQEALVKRSTFSVESVLPPVPQSFKCPITHEVMRDPVMTQDGHVYESDAIQEWFRRGHRTSPVTGVELINLALLPEVPLRRAIEEYMALRPEIARREITLRSDLLTLRNVAEKLEQELKMKDQMLRELRSSEAPGLATKEFCSSCSSASNGPCEPPSHSQRSECAEGAASAGKGTSPEKLRPVFATLPTPCRDSARARNVPAETSRPTQPAPPRTTKLQDLIKAMSWRGRSARRHPRARSQDSDARY